MLDSNIRCGARVLHEVNAPTQIPWCIGDRFDIPAIDLPQKVWYCVLGFVGSLGGIGLLAEHNSSRLLRFVQFPTFVRDWKRLRLGDEALQALERELIDAPDTCPVIEQTGGLRKLRFSPPGSGRGKSGAYRVVYAYFPVHGTVALFVVFGKNERSDLSPGEAHAAANALRAFESELHRQLDHRREKERE
jgi:mRNA-degrading endonuclease RelE of RelBE toxin-antitoxin system